MSIGSGPPEWARFLLRSCRRRRHAVLQVYALLLSMFLLTLMQEALGLPIAVPVLVGLWTVGMLAAIAEFDRHRVWKQGGR